MPTNLNTKMETANNFRKKNPYKICNSVTLRQADSQQLAFAAHKGHARQNCCMSLGVVAYFKQADCLHLGAAQCF